MTFIWPAIEDASLQCGPSILDRRAVDRGIGEQALTPLDVVAAFTEAVVDYLIVPTEKCLRAGVDRAVCGTLLAFR